MTIKAQAPADTITCPRCGMTSAHPTDIAEGYCGNCHDWTRVAVGDRFTYTNKVGDVAHYRVADRDVTDYDGNPGFLRLVADEGSGRGTVLITPRSLFSSYGWARDETAADEGVGRGEEPRPVSEGTEPVASPDAGQRQSEADCSDDLDEWVDEYDDELDCTHCDGGGDCFDGSDPLGDCPDEAHPCHACGGSGRRSDQRIF
jgi:hypothetical protein